MVKKIQQGKYRWSLERKDGKVLNKYNEDGTKNIYHWRDGEGVLHTFDRSNIKSWGLTDPEGNVTAVMDVPDGAKVFQRRRVVDVNYYHRFHNVTIKTGGYVSGGRWIPEGSIVKPYPEYTYGQLWLIGWRKREADGSITVFYKAVYPDGKVDDHDAWIPHTWLKEPQWFSEEEV